MAGVFLRREHLAGLARLGFRCARFATVRMSAASICSAHGVQRFRPLRTAASPFSGANASSFANGGLGQHQGHVARKVMARVRRPTAMVEIVSAGAIQGLRNYTSWADPASGGFRRSSVNRPFICIQLVKTGVRERTVESEKYSRGVGLGRFGLAVH
jgi:hypothetical protein